MLKTVIHSELKVSVSTEMSLKQPRFVLQIVAQEHDMYPHLATGTCDPNR